MNIKAGQGLFMLIDQFADGGECRYARPFLVIDVDDSNQYISVLNVSSIKKDNGHKLLYNSNKKIVKYKPPFIDPSYVKFDAVYEVEYSSNITVLQKGSVMDSIEFEGIIQDYSEYEDMHEIPHIRAEVRPRTFINVKAPIH